MTALTLGRRGDNLPAELTRFIGRRRELLAIADAIENHRLVTLRGPGGVGKTRLAVRAARAARDAFADGVWLVELSALRTPGLLARTVAATLGLPDEASLDALDALATNLAERELLLVLDTCEHLIEDCARLAGTLLSSAPGLRVLATSRQPLVVPGEHVLPVAPLGLPAGSGHVANSDAVALFVDRAMAAVPGFGLTSQNAGAVAELCRRLDGIPLALELAAVRLRGMSAEELLARLADRFRILGTARTATGRHRTLRATVSWSYELCTPAERRLWAELSVFPGSFTLEAAEHVCGQDTHQTLARLVDKSVLLSSGAASSKAAAPGTPPRRYQMLDTMREFGAERLAAADAERLRVRHRDYYLGLARRASAGSLTGEQVDWLAWLGAETDNLRVGLDYSFLAPGQQSGGLAMTTLLRPYWLMVGQFTEGRRWHELAAQTDPGSRENAWAVFGAGVLAVKQGDFAAGRPLLDRAAALAARGGDEDLAAHVTDARGMIAFHSGDLQAAQAAHEEAIAAFERIGFSDPPALVSYGHLASVCLVTLDLERAVALCEECLRRCDQVGEQWARGTALWVRGGARWMSGDIPAAIEDALACLRIKETVGDLHTIAMSFDLLAVCLVAAAEFERAAVLYAAGDELWTLLNAPVLTGPAYAEIRKNAADTARDRLGADRFEALARSGRAMPLGTALAVARGEAPTGGAGAAGAGAWAQGGTEPVKPLTRREKEIAVLVAAGLGNREIAAQLFLSKRTVDSHIEHTFAKLGFNSRAQLAGWVMAQQAAGQAEAGTTGPLHSHLPQAPACGGAMFTGSGGCYIPARHRAFTGGRQSLPMSHDAGSGMPRRQMLAAGSTGLASATATGSGRAAALRQSEAVGGTPEQVHLTWGDDPARSVVVSWASPGRAVAPRVRIGQRVIPATERAYTDGLSGEVTWTYHARLDGLRPGATYGYAVTADNDANAAEEFSATFSTAPGGRPAFRFTSFGDLATPNQRWAGSYGQAAYAVGAVEAFQPLFHLLAGDLAYADLNPAAQPKVWRDFGNNVQASAAHRPWLPVPGNHEHEFGDDADGLTSYLTRYTLPANGAGELEGRWYSFRVGTVVFVCLNSADVAYQDAGAFVGGPAPLLPAASARRPPVPPGGSRYARGYSRGTQTRWLEATLAAARRDPVVDWIVVQFHQCACSSSAGNGSDLGIRREWLPLFDAYEVDLVLSGHDHGYERSFPVRGFDALAGVDEATGAAVETLRPRPVTTTDSGVFDTSQGTVHLVLGCGGAAPHADGRAPGATPGPVAPAAKVFTRRNQPVPAERTGAHGQPGTWSRPTADAVEAATWSARRDTVSGYGIAVFDVHPGTEAGGQTSITVRYYHAAGADPVSPVTGEPGAPAGDYPLYESFTLVRPRSDGRRWHPPG